MPDYHQRFRERFVAPSRVTKSGEEVHAEPSLILAFMDEVDASAFARGYEGSIEDHNLVSRAALIEKIEGMGCTPDEVKTLNRVISHLR